MEYEDGMKSVDSFKARAEASQKRQLEFYRRQSQYLLGRPAEEIPKTLVEIEERQLSSVPELSDGVGAEWYGGSASVTFGAIYGNLTAKIGFTDGSWVFDTNFWGFGVSGVTAGGGGPWGVGWTSPGGLKMDFQVLTAAYGGGVLQVFWIYNRAVVGSFVGPAVGAGAITGGGSGTWKKA